jgi:hypothetical protein
MTTNAPTSVPAVPPQPPTADAAATRPSARPGFDVRYGVPMLVTLILLGGNYALGVLESPWKTGLAIVTAIGMEIILSKLTLGRWPHLASAYVSGISVGILVRSPYYWPYALCSALTITSKYAIRVRGRHIFNPSNFGIVMMLFLAPMAVASLSIQWGNTLLVPAVIWTIGFTILYRIRRLHISVTYIISFLGFAALRAAFLGLPQLAAIWATTGSALAVLTVFKNPLLAEIAPITGPMYQLFTLFMVTDPKTTVGTRRGQILVVFLVALVECILRLMEIVHAPYYALFLVGPSALLFEMWRKGRRAAAEAAADAAAEAAAPSVA